VVIDGFEQIFAIVSQQSSSDVVQLMEALPAGGLQRTANEAAKSSLSFSIIFYLLCDG
jgi:hypothetical protein